MRRERRRGRVPGADRFADRHLGGGREVAGGATHSRVALLEGVARLEELGRMVGGVTFTITGTTRRATQHWWWRGGGSTCALR